MVKQFYDKPIFTIINYLISFVQTSIYFALSNILLLGFLVLTYVNPAIFNLLLLYICLIPLIPALCALYSAIGSSLRKKDPFFASYYFSYYKKDMKANFKLGTIYLTIAAVLFIDFQYFYLNNRHTGLYIVFLLLLCILGIILLYALPINSRFKLSFKDLFLSSVYYAIKKLPLTILKVTILAVTYYLIKNYFVALVFFIPALICILFMYYDKSILTELEKKAKIS